MIWLELESIVRFWIGIQATATPPGQEDARRNKIPHLQIHSHEILLITIIKPEIFHKFVTFIEARCIESEQILYSIIIAINQ